MAWRLAPAVAAACVAVVYLATGAGGGDLAAHVFRADLFGREGFALWNGAWYGGHHAVAYSVLFPPLGWLLGVEVAGALGAVAAAALFEPLTRRHFGEHAGVRLGTIWFGVAAGAMLFTGRLPFMVGTAVALGALLALQRGRPVLATALAVVTPLASPPAALFLAMAGVAIALAGEVRRGAALALGAFLPLVVLAVLFPEGGYQPFSVTPLAIAIPLIAAAAVIVLPPRERALRIGAALYGLGTLAALMLDTAVGSNALRVAELFAGPVLACALIGAPAAQSAPRPRSWPVLVALMLLPLAYWGMWPAVRDIANADGDPAFEASYYRPLTDFLGRQGAPAWRVEIPFTRAHFEAAEVAPDHPLARGWQRQLDAKFNDLFYEGKLTHSRYERWLRENGVRFVALPDATMDFSARRERELARSPAARRYLKPVWRSGHWQVFEVRRPGPLAVGQRGPGRIDVERLTPQGAELRATGPAAATLRIRWSPYWRVRGGCVERSGDWTRVEARLAGVLVLEQSFAPERIFSRGRRCG